MIRQKMIPSRPLVPPPVPPLVPPPVRPLFRSPVRPTLGVILILLLAAACGADEASFEGEAAPLWSVVPELRIGSIDDPEYAFGRVTALVVGPQGSLYSLHPQEAEIRRWTSDGAAAGTVGGRGEGPGEFTAPRAIGWRADSLWVYDGGNSRFSFFGPEGSFLGSFLPPVDLGRVEQGAEVTFPPRPNGLLEDGTVHSVTPSFSQEIVEGRLTRVDHVRAGREGETLDTLATLAVGPNSTLGVLRDGGGTFTGQPFGDASSAGRAAGGTALLILDRPAAAEPGTAHFRVTRLSLRGDTVYSRDYPYRPRPLPQTAVDSAVGTLAESLHRFMGEQTGTGLSQWSGWVREAMYIPAHYPPVSQLLPGRDGTVWLKLHPPDEDGPEWLVTAEDGELLARVAVPEELRLLAADRSHLWGVELDEYDVEYIVRYRVVAP